MKLDKEILISNLFPRKFTNFIDHNANFISTVEANQAVDKNQKRKPSVCFNVVSVDKEEFMMAAN